MLRISSDNGNTGNTATREAGTATPAAAGSTDTEAPSVESGTVNTPRSIQKPIEGNHASHVLPWLTEEIRFHAALDLGCADGSAVKLLQEAGYDGHGIDLSPSAQGISNITTGDFFNAPYENSTFDVVICCNVLHEVPNHRISELLAEINRLSNSYIMITTPSTECHNAEGEVRSISWWCERISDFNWRYRIIREDPETGHMVILAEKPDSLAAQILPLIDAGELDGNNSETDPATQAINLIDRAVNHLDAGESNEGFTVISQLADMLLQAELNLASVQPLFTEIISAMESRNIEQVVSILRNDLRSALAAS